MCLLYLTVSAYDSLLDTNALTDGGICADDRAGGNDGLLFDFGSSCDEVQNLRRRSTWFYGLIRLPTLSNFTIDIEEATTL